MVGLSCFVMVSYRVLSVWPCFCLTQKQVELVPSETIRIVCFLRHRKFCLRLWQRKELQSEGVGHMWGRGCSTDVSRAVETSFGIMMFGHGLWRYYKLKGLQHHLSCAFSFTCCKILREEVNVDLAHFSYVWINTFMYAVPQDTDRPYSNI